MADVREQDRKQAKRLKDESDAEWNAEIRAWLSGRCQSAVAPDPWKHIMPRLAAALAAARSQGRAEEREREANRPSEFTTVVALRKMMADHATEMSSEEFWTLSDAAFSLEAAVERARGAAEEG